MYIIYIKRFLQEIKTADSIKTDAAQAAPAPVPDFTKIYCMAGKSFQMKNKFKTVFKLVFFHLFCTKYEMIEKNQLIYNYLN
jgi:hypothetical protein